MKGKHWILGLICLSFLVVSAFCANAADKKPDVYTVALLGDMTGPYASVVGPMVPGAEDAIQYVNEQLGGIDGVKMKLVSRDNTGKAALGLQQYSELIGMTPKPNFFSVPHTPTAEALREKIVADDVLGFFPGSVPDLYPQGNAYSFYSLYPQQSAVFIMWLRANWTEERNPRVAIITWDQAYGRAILTPEFFEFCKKMKVDIVAQELFGVRDVDLTTHLVRIRAKNPDWLITNNTGPGPVAIMRAVKELGMNVKLANNVGGDWGTIRLDPQLFEGCISVLYCASYDDQEHSGIKQIYGYLQKNNRGVKEQTGFYILGWQYVLMVHKVVGEAVARVGWDKLSTAAIKTEMNKLTDWAPLDGVVKVTYTDRIRQSPYLRIYKVQGGQLVPPGGKLGGNEFIKAPDLTPEAYR